MKFGERHESWTRRRLIGSGCGAFVATTLVGSSNARATETSKIVQPSKPTPDEFAKRAFEMRDLAVTQGDRGYGAVIVNTANLQIVGQAPSRVVTQRDPSAHGEMEAIRDAARRLPTGDLSNHVMYSSSRPCPMCEAAAYWANLDAMYFGRKATNAGAPVLCRSN